MELEREKVIVLANCIKDFVTFISDHYHSNYSNITNKDKLFRLKLITEEFRFNMIANELLRLNKQGLEEHQTKQLIERFKEAFRHIVEYIENNEDDLFIFSGRIYTLKHYCDLLPL